MTIISANISAINARRQMGANQSLLQNSMEKLSSGLRINRAGDDAAGLAISEKMHAQIRGLEQASRNSQDGISMIQTAEAALNETHGILQRMRELAVQASNDVNTALDRKAIQQEINALTSEINRIGNTTAFNNHKLLQGGIETEGEVTASSRPATLGTPNESGTVSFTIIYPLAAGETIHAGGETITSYADALDSVGDAYGIHAEQTAEEQADTIRKMQFPDLYTMGATNNVILVQNEAGKGNVTSASLTGNEGVITEIYQKNATEGIPAEPGSSAFTITTALQAGEILRVGGQAITTYTDAVALIEANNVYGIHEKQTAEQQAASIRDMPFANLDATGANSNVLLTQVVAGTGNIAPAFVSASPNNMEDGFTAILQTGANSGQNMTITIGDMRAEALGLASYTARIENEGSSIHQLTADSIPAHAIFDREVGVSNGLSGSKTQRAISVSSHQAASAAIKVVNHAIETVSAQRSRLGAYQNRLEYTISNVNHSSEHLSIAESRIRHVDMAKEMMTMVKNNIMYQASQSMLVQANQQPQAVLQLLS